MVENTAAEKKAAHLAAVQAGRAEASNLSEILAVDFPALLDEVLPDLVRACPQEVAGLQQLGISARMAETGRLLLAHLEPGGRAEIQAHGSDTVRGWACFMIAAQGLPLADQLLAIRPLADDPHFGVREWAWLAVRPALSDNLEKAFALLMRWTQEPSAYLRRFACEATRPRGVWCRHIAALKTGPEAGLPLLEALRADPSPYVQDSVGNWLNDAAKSRPDWVRSVVARWLDGPASPNTVRIARRALRSLDKPKRGSS
ncbi:DNA alkylation repair protein [Xanthobacter sp. TB0139]|uniref:DNA alkylation repair protein n=1 Tax=Xanthobacter sp. TB0139 TaxID=3459178 RepID=UPI004039776C